MGDYMYLLLFIFLLSYFYHIDFSIIMIIMIKFLSSFDYNIIAIISNIIIACSSLFLGIVSIYQTYKSYSLSEKMLNNSLNNSLSIPHILNKIDINYTENDNASIIISTHHRFDYGAIIAVEESFDNPTKYNLYLLDLYFNIQNNNYNIKDICINDILVVQDPCEGGLVWDDNSNNPIPLSLNIKFNHNAILNWVSADEFYIQLKIYCEPDSLFDVMFKDTGVSCIILNTSILSLDDVTTNINYKLWIRSDNGISVIKSNSLLMSNDYNQ